MKRKHVALYFSSVFRLPLFMNLQYITLSFLSVCCAPSICESVTHRLGWVCRSPSNLWWPTPNWLLITFFAACIGLDSLYRVFNLKVDRQPSREYFRSDAIYNGSADRTLYYYVCRSWQDCCRKGENRSWPSVSVDSVDSECWCLNNDIFFALLWCG
jgi:hypothetical protein